MPARVCGAGMGSFITEKIPPTIIPVRSANIISFMIGINITSFETSYQSSERSRNLPSPEADLPAGGTEFFLIKRHLR
jgi:hypothetical protein